MNKSACYTCNQIFFNIYDCILILNLLTMKEASISSIIVRTVIAAIVFFVIYIIVFTILSSSERKLIYGTTCLLRFYMPYIRAIFFTPRIGIIAGLIIGVFAGVIWEFLNRKMEVAHLDYYYRTHCNYFVNH